MSWDLSIFLFGLLVYARILYGIGAWLWTKRYHPVTVRFFLVSTLIAVGIPELGLGIVLFIWPAIWLATMEVLITFALIIWWALSRPWMSKPIWSLWWVPVTGFILYLLFPSFIGALQEFNDPTPVAQTQQRPVADTGFRD